MMFCLSTTEFNMSTAALRFKDVKDADYFARGVYKLVDKGAISGYGNGNFGANDSMTRSQYIKTLVAATIGVQPKGDTGKGLHLLENYMLKAFELGIVTETEFPKSTWDTPITREDMAKVLVRAMVSVLKENQSTDYKDYEGSLIDINTYGTESKDFILQAYAKGLIAGYVDGSFGGKDNMIRAQACATILRLIDKTERISPKKPDSTTAQYGWSDQAFEKLMNGFLNDTDSTLIDCFYLTRNFYQKSNTSYLAKVENKTLYFKDFNISGGALWDKYKAVQFSEKELPGINARLYTAFKNLVYNAYVNGGTVEVTGAIGNEAFYNNSFPIQISYQNRPTSKIQSTANSPMNLPDWTVIICPTAATELSYLDMGERYVYLPQAQRDKLENLNKDNAPYHLYWRVNSLCTPEYRDAVRSKLPIAGGFYDTRKANFVEEKPKNTFKMFVNDIYSTTNGSKLSEFMIEQYHLQSTNGLNPVIPGSINYSLFNSNVNLDLPFRIMVAVESDLTKPRVWTGWK